MNRSLLDFDFEKLCSVTLNNNNVYCCLVDGKFFQGRGKSSPAYAHALNEDHHVFLNLETLKVGRHLISLSSIRLKALLAGLHSSRSV